MTVVITGSDLTIEQTVAVARDGARVEIDAAARAHMAKTRAIVDEVRQGDSLVYGLTSGVGMRRHTRVSSAEVIGFNKRMIASHRFAQGPEASEDLVRAAMLRLANGLVKGFVGVRPELAEHIVAQVNGRHHPAVRLYGSAGQSDLGPMADLAAGLSAGFELEAKEALALINNNAFSTGGAALAFHAAEQLLETLDLAAAFDLEAFAANVSVLHPRVDEARPYRGLQESRATIADALAGSFLWEAGSARNLQDPLSFRAVAGLHGSARDAFRFVRAQLGIELNSSQDNPIVVPEERKIISVGKDMQPLATAMDIAHLALAPVLTAACERTVKLLQSHHSGLPGGLAKSADLPEEALAEYGVGAQALAAEARLLAQPVSFELASSSQADGIEDRTMMTPLAVRRLADMVQFGARLVAIELVVAAQAVELRRPSSLGRRTRALLARIREEIPFVDLGEDIPPSIESVVELVRTGSLASIAAEAGS